MQRLAANAFWVFQTVVFASTPAWSAEDSTSVHSTAISPRVSASTHWLFSNSKDELDPAAEVQNTLTHEGTLRAEYGEAQGELTFDNRFRFPRTDAALSNTQEAFILEKKRLGWVSEQWEVSLGDTHQELGRGVALSLNKNAAFGVDNTLEGLSAQYRGDTVETRAFAGRVNAWDLPLAVNPEENPLTDREFLIGGGAVQVSPVSLLKIGGHGFYAANRSLPSLRYDKTWQTIGGSIGVAPFASEEVDFYAEINRMTSQARGTTVTDLPTARGTYVALSYTPENWKFKLEGKDYRNYQFEFRRPPTLEEDIVETLNTEDVSAYRLAVEHRLSGTRHSLQASALQGEERVLKTRLYHGVVGAKFGFDGGASLETRAGYRFLPDHTRLFHASVRGKLRTLPGQSLELGLRKQLSDENLNFLPTSQDRNLLEVTYNFSEKFALSTGGEYVPTNDEALGAFFLNLGASYKTGDLATRAFVGRTSGGTQCAGGICRQVPPYSGAMLDLTYSL